MEDRHRRPARQAPVRDAEQLRRQDLAAERLAPVEAGAEVRRPRGAVDVDDRDRRRGGRADAPREDDAQARAPAAIRAPADDEASRAVHARALDVAPAAARIEALQGGAPPRGPGHRAAHVHDLPDDRGRRDEHRARARRAVAGRAGARRDQRRHAGAARGRGRRARRRRRAAREARAEHGERDAVAAWAEHRDGPPAEQGSTRPTQPVAGLARRSVALPVPRRAGVLAARRHPLPAHRAGTRQTRAAYSSRLQRGRRSNIERSVARPTSRPMRVSSLASCTLVVTRSATAETFSSTGCAGVA